MVIAMGLHLFKDVVIWVDAVSINQNDADEKHRQITLMGQIYVSANDVFVWLGDGNRTCDQGMECLRRGTILLDPQSISNAVIKLNLRNFHVWKTVIYVWFWVHFCRGRCYQRMNEPRYLVSLTASSPIPRSQPTLSIWTFPLRTLSLVTYFTDASAVEFADIRMGRAGASVATEMCGQLKMPKSSVTF